MSLEELIERMDVGELSADRVINFQECSASTAEGIWEGLNTLLEIFERRDLLRPSVQVSATAAEAAQETPQSNNAQQKIQAEQPSQAMNDIS